MNTLFDHLLSNNTFDKETKNLLIYKKAILNSMTKSQSTLNTAIPGMVGYSTDKAKKEIEKNKEFSWILKG